MFENPRKGRQARNFTTNAPKILDLKSSSEQIFSRKLSLGAPVIYTHFFVLVPLSFSNMVAILVKERFLLSYGHLKQCDMTVHIYIYKEYTQPNSQGSSLWNALENGFFHQTYTLYTLRFHSGPQAACDNVTSAGRLTLTKQMLNWKLDITNHYITKSSV